MQLLQKVVTALTGLSSWSFSLVCDSHGPSFVYLLGLASLLTASLVFQCSFGAGKAGPEKATTIRTSVFGAACVCWGRDVVGQGAALKRDGQAEVLQGSWGIPVVGQPNVMV